MSRAENEQGFTRRDFIRIFAGAGLLATGCGPDNGKKKLPLPPTLTSPEVTATQIPDELSLLRSIATESRVQNIPFIPAERERWEQRNTLQVAEIFDIATLLQQDVHAMTTSQNLELKTPGDTLQAFIESRDLLLVTNPDSGNGTRNHLVSPGVRVQNGEVKALAVFSEAFIRNSNSLDRAISLTRTATDVTHMLHYRDAHSDKSIEEQQIGMLGLFSQPEAVSIFADGLTQQMKAMLVSYRTTGEPLLFNVVPYTRLLQGYKNCGYDFRNEAGTRFIQSEMLDSNQI